MALRVLGLPEVELPEVEPCCARRGKQVQVSDSWFVGNQADNSGAGLVFDKTNANVQGSVFKNNRAEVRTVLLACRGPCHGLGLSVWLAWH